jgi:hypothetical protein
LGVQPNFGFKNANKNIILQNNDKYYKKREKLRKELEEKVIQSNPDFCKMYDERKNKQRHFSNGKSKKEYI